tara:strand:- start:5998 stop:6741 length:744 start_codon:yes stop_codon:yes gene_type:complete
MKKKDLPLGIILYECDEWICIATGFKNSSANDKTGAMIQTWILVKELKPTEALKQGLDWLVCGDCKHRGHEDENGKHGVDRTCYVNLGQGPRAVWDAWVRGRYENLNSENVKAFTGRKIRLGSYGDPAYVPFRIWKLILKYGENSHTGYTHQWKHAPHLKEICMASVDSFDETMLAWEQGWRTFRMGVDPLDGEVLCPASEQAGKKTTCANCGLCGGKSKQAKSVYIPPHGTGKKHFKNVDLDLSIK